MNILIVEDSNSEYVFLSGALERAIEEPLGLTHKQTIKGAIAWLKDNRDEVDLVFLDLGLPDTISRSDAFEQVEPFLSHVPVIIMTGDNDERLAYELLAQGAEDYIVKGSTRRRHDLLKETVYYAVSRHQSVKKLNDKITADERSIHWLSGGYSV